MNVLPDESRRLLPQVESAYYAIDFQDSSIAEKFEKIIALDPARSDNAMRVERVLAFCDRWFSASRGLSALRALDVGAGIGVFPARFLERSGPRWSMTAVESDPLAAGHLKGLRRFDVVEDVFPSENDLGHFQLVTLNKVVEHFARPVELLQSIVPSLDPKSALIYIEVPDKATVVSRASDDNILGALHRHLYDLKSLLVLIEAAGLVALQVERIVDPSGKLSVFAFATTRAAVSLRNQAGN
jgi:2-polyprenyl-3-methyl-5-hydroxy-6-metoxy-1,4-benzoquinol methylase